ncbi:VanW family protein [Clostridium sediminicola]|uniref:VanW family protein n=1 Tax=Clostridium sediminicola TaxID=3114879 RepID=UPI0031F244A4
MENNSENKLETTSKKRIRRKKKKSNNKKKILGAVMGIAIVCAAIIGYLYLEVKKWDNKMMPNISIEKIDYTGKSKAEVLSVLNEIYGNNVLEKIVEIQGIDKTYSIGYTELDVKYNIDETVEKAFEHGRELGLIDKFKLIKNPKTVEFDLEFTYNKKAIENVINTMEKEINAEPVNATIKYLGNGKFEVKDDVKGAKLDFEKLSKDINEKIQSEADDLTILAPINELVADVTGEQLRSIDSNVGSYSTNYKTSSWARSTNIDLATKAINGTILMPGEEFSFNDVVGKRTEAKGYQVAHVIVRGEYVDGLGGGICQVSTTLYNAALLAGLEITERSHHTYPSSYVPIGRDATVDYGNIDLKFVNNQEYPIYISAYTSNKSDYFTIYSSNNLNKTEERIWNDVYKTFPATYKTIEDPTLTVGTEEIDKKPHTGYKVKVYRQVTENGVKGKVETVSSDYFVPSNGEKRVGTKVVEEPVVGEETPTEGTGTEETPTTETIAE